MGAEERLANFLAQNEQTPNTPEGRLSAALNKSDAPGLISGAGARPITTPTEIKNPPTTMDYVKSGLRQAQESALPTLGLMAGGLASVPVLGPLLAGTGYAAGNAMNRFGRNVADTIVPPVVPRPQPSAWDEAKNIGGDFMTGAALDMVPTAAMAAGQRGLGVVKNMLGLGAPSAETQAIRAAAERQGITLPAGAASDSRAVSQIEAVPGRFPIGVQSSQPTFTKINKQAQTAAERVAQQAGPAELEQAGLAVKREVGDIAGAQQNAPTELVDRFSQSLGRTPGSRIEAGQQVSAGLQGSQATVRAKADDLYAAARAEAPADAALVPTNANRVASNMAALEQRLGKLGNRSRGVAETIQGETAPAEHTIDGVPMPQRFIQQYGLDQPLPIPLDLATELLKRVRALGRATTNDVEKSQFRDLATALSTDVSEYGASVGGALGPKLAQASQFYRDEVARDFAPKSFVRKLIDMEPGRISETVLTAQPDKIAAIMRQTPAAQRPTVQRMVFDKLRERSVSPATGDVDPAKFESALRAYGEDNLRAVFGSRIADLNAMRATIQRNFGRQPAQQGPGFGNIGNAYETPMGARPENVVKLMTGKGRSGEDLNALWNVLSPGTREMTGAAALNDVVAQAKNTTTGMFSTDRFMTSAGKVPDEVWQKILPPEVHAAFKDLRLVYERLNTHAKAAANPSQTSMAHGGMGQVLGAAGIVGSAALGHEDGESIAKKALVLVSPYLIGKAVFSGAGQRLLTSQPSTPVNPQGPFSTLSKVLGAQLVGR